MSYSINKTCHSGLELESSYKTINYKKFDLGGGMCLAIPVQIIRLLDDNRAIIALSGVEKEVSLALLNEEINVNDYVIIHVGYAISKLDELEAQRTLSDIAQIL